MPAVSAIFASAVRRARLRLSRAGRLIIHPEETNCFLSGHPAIDRYLAEGYSHVRGMSSRFAAAICGYLISHQAGEKIPGNILEIGVFEGRFFIAMALGLQPEERAYALDVFSWPDAGVRERFQANCKTFLVPPDSIVEWKANTAALDRDTLKAELGDQQIRFAHIDAEHQRQFLLHDLELVHGVLHPAGIVCVDDMLHPSYPTLITAVFDYLQAHPEMRVLCVIDREDIVAAPQLLLCHLDWLPRYHRVLASAFAAFRFYIEANMETYGTIVLTPRPLVVDIGPASHD